MSYSPAELITYNLGQLRRHMTAQGCTDADWRAALERELAKPQPAEMTRPGDKVFDL